VLTEKVPRLGWERERVGETMRGWGEGRAYLIADVAADAYEEEEDD